MYVNRYRLDTELSQRISVAGWEVQITPSLAKISWTTDHSLTGLDGKKTESSERDGD